MDVAEIALFNNALAGMNLAGNRFFYVNPLESDGAMPFNQGESGRAEWFDTACCPTNLARIIPQVPGLLYAYDRNSIYVTLYGSSRTTVPLRAGSVTLIQRSDYPYSETIEFWVNPERSQRFDLKLRIPTWAQGQQFLPGNLYRYIDGDVPVWTVQINGQAAKPRLEAGFAIISRKWRKGDRITLRLPMPVKFNTARTEVEADRGSMALTRGPLVLCAEGVDNDGPVQEVALLDTLPAADQIETSAFVDGLLAGILKVSLPANRNGAPHQLVMVPYFAWNNRGNGTMRVWLPRTESNRS